MINVIEHTTASYPGRTAVNVRDSDGTIAFAYDFDSAGEKLTEKMCKQYNIKHLNIAGNGIRTMQGIFTQEILDTYLYKIFKKVLESYPLEHARSGGQTGADEAGVKALDQLGVETTIVYPKGYRIRTLTKDIYDKNIAAKRFEQKINPDLPLVIQKYNIH